MPQKHKPKRRPAAAPHLTAREEMILLIVKELTLQQQRELVMELRALLDANRVARHQMNGKQFRTASNEIVRAAFHEVPTPAKESKKKPGRDLGDAMGDFLE